MVANPVKTYENCGPGQPTDIVRTQDNQNPGRRGEGSLRDLEWLNHGSRFLKDLGLS